MVEEFRPEPLTPDKQKGLLWAYENRGSTDPTSAQAAAKILQKAASTGHYDAERDQLWAPPKASALQKTQALLTGAARSASAGIGDMFMQGLMTLTAEGMQKGGRALDWVGKKTGVESLQGLGLPDTPWSDTVEMVRQAYNEEADRIKNLAPGYAKTGDVLGFLVPGGAAGKLTKFGLKAAGKLGTGVAARVAGRVGAEAAGMGTYEGISKFAETGDIGEAGKAAAKGTLMGAAAVPGGYLLGKAATGLGKAGKYITKQAFQSLRGLSDRALAMFVKNPELVKEAVAAGAEGMAEGLRNQFNKVASEYIPGLIKLRDEALAKSGKTVSFGEVYDIFVNKIKELSGGRMNLSKTKGAVEDLVVELNNLKQRFSVPGEGFTILDREAQIGLPELNKFKSDLWELARPVLGKESGGGRVAENAFKSIAAKVKALVDKNAGPEYELWNKQLWKNNFLRKALRRFGIDKGRMFDPDDLDEIHSLVMREEGLLNYEGALKFLESLTGKGARQYRYLVDQLDRQMGTKVGAMADLWGAAKEFSYGATEKLSKFATGKSLLGLALGAATGGVAGTAGAGLAGLAAAGMAAPALTSPLIKAGTALGKAGRATGRMIESVAPRAVYRAKKEE